VKVKGVTYLPRRSCWNLSPITAQFNYDIHISDFIFNYNYLIYLQISIKAYNNSISFFVVFLVLNSFLEQSWQRLH